MRQLLITAVIVLLVAACAPNPLGLAEGMWVRNKLDGQKYYITRLSREQNAEHGGLVRVKNEMGAEVDKDFAIHDFELWIDRPEVNNTTDPRILALRKELEEISNRISTLEEKTKVSGERRWNPETQKYE